MDSKITYFVTAGAYVKIGSTQNIAKRVASLQVSCPYRVVDVRVTDQITEVDAHRKAVMLTTRVGEWFQENEKLRAWIDTIPNIRKEFVKLRNGKIKVQTATQPAPPTLPEVSLKDLPENTKDFLLAHAATGKPITEIIRDILNAAAKKHLPA